jgi:hypothetical protein
MKFRKGGDIPAGMSWQTRGFAPPVREFHLKNNIPASIGRKSVWRNPQNRGGSRGSDEEIFEPLKSLSPQSGMDSWF